MQEQTNYAGLKTTNWGAALENTRFRNKLIAGVIMLTCILLLFPYFFAYIEKRNGVILDDILLRYIGPVDLSIPIFIIIWSTTLLFIIRSFYFPVIFINAVYCLSFLSLMRMLSIYLTPLDPPATLIAIKDPLTSITYGGKDVFMTKDLFFSGHTSNMLMLALCFEKRNDRLIGFLAAVSVGVLVLFQHAHYTIDVVAAFLITGFVVLFGKKAAEH
ncbi:MAG TPA: phosphatase PAP2-related protein [Ferruginibacter sp.]|nr:phosphatase PAP2-related protein [Ferruginibacter sp.]HPH89879.1 phosphatase PAP2-related protein [Ferruginibacter sp.]